MGTGTTPLEANITIEHVNIASTSKSAFLIMNKATVNLTLAGENHLKSGSGYAGLQVAGGGTLIITKESEGGSLTATGGGSTSKGGAGIGGSPDTITNANKTGTIEINGGTITAIGAMNSAGIGGSTGTAGTIVINGGNIEAVGGKNGAGIGSGGSSGTATITINDGTITKAQGGENGAGIGGGGSTGGIININGGIITEAIGGSYGAGIGGAGSNAGGTININGGEIKKAQGGEKGAGIGGGNGGGGTITIDGACSITANGGKNSAGIGSGGSREDGGKITIIQGTVTAQGGYYGAGIGGSDSKSGGTVNISGGTITANGNTSNDGTIEDNKGGAGIGGGGNKGAGGTINISGGTIIATGAARGSGIGGGGSRVNTGAAADPGLGGTITISGGHVTAKSAGTGAGIGGGSSNAPKGTFVTTDAGQAWVYTSNINVVATQAAKDSWQGVLFIGQNPGIVRGEQTLNDTWELSATQELVLQKDSSLTLKAGATLTNNGSISNNGSLILESGSVLNNNHIITNNGTVRNFGTVNNASGTIQDYGTWEGIKPESGTYNGSEDGSSFTRDGLTITGPAAEGAISYHPGTGFTLSRDGSYTVTGTWTGSLDTMNGSAVRSVIQVKSGITADIVFTDVNINTSGKTEGTRSRNTKVMNTKNAGAVSLLGNAIVNLTLQGKNILTSGENCAGFSVPASAVLNISAMDGGSLSAAGGAKGAGIGGSNSVAAGTITVSSGIITATGGLSASGIGGGAGGGNGSFNTGNDGGGIWIVASSISDDADTSRWKGIIFKENEGAVYGGCTLRMDSEIPSGQILVIPDGSSLTIPQGVTLKNKGILTNKGTITNEGLVNNEQGIINSYEDEGIWYGSKPEEGMFNESKAADEEVSNGLTVQSTVTDSILVDSSNGTFTLTGDGNYIIYGTWTDSNTNFNTIINIPDGIKANILLNGLTISNLKARRIIALTGGTEVDLTLKGTNTLSSTNGTALMVAEGSSLVITEESTGILNATGNTGIGGDTVTSAPTDFFCNNGSINIKGGTINAQANENGGAGIGGGSAGSSGNKNVGGIIIDGGTITATGGNYAAGIGGGASGDGGTIEINGGKIKATGGIYGGAGIGSGNGQTEGATLHADITITGGEVTAYGGGTYGGAGIGGGIGNAGGSVTISGGFVTATGSEKGAGIGDGYTGGSCVIEISGGIVKAAGGKGASGIGTGSEQAAPSTFTTTDTGKAFIITDSISDRDSEAEWKGTIFIDTLGRVYGAQEALKGADIHTDYKLTIPDGSSLTIPSGLNWSNKGTITNNGTMTNNGTVNNGSGTIISHGYWGGPQPNPLGIFRTVSASALTFSIRDGSADISHGNYGDILIIEANANQPAPSTKMRSAANDTVNFYLGAVSDGVLLGTGTVNTTNGMASASIEVPLTEALGFLPQSEPYTIIAEFGGTVGLFPSTTEKALTVNKRPITLSLAADKTSPKAKVDVILTAKVTGYAAEKIPSGTVTFRYGETVISEGIRIETAEGTLQAQTVWKQVPGGDYSLTGEYVPDTDDRYQCKELSAIDNYHIDKLTQMGFTFQGENPLEKTLGTDVAEFSVSASGGQSGGAVTYKVTKGAGVISVSNENNGTLILLSEGEAEITAEKAGDLYYEPTSTVLKISVAKTKEEVIPEEEPNKNPGRDNPRKTLSYNGSYSLDMKGGQSHITISRYDINKLVNEQATVTIQKPEVTISFDAAAWKAVADTAGGDIRMNVSPVDISRFPEAISLIGTHPLYDVTFRYGSSWGSMENREVNFGTGNVTVAIAYTPAAGELPGNLFAASVDGNGKAALISKSGYDSNRKAIIFNVNHFSIYGVAYQTPVQAFADIAIHWAKEDIDFVTARGILTGTGGAQFSPDAPLTEKQFADALGHLAAQKNITIVNIAQNPDGVLTRERMAVMMNQYAMQTGETIPAVIKDAPFADQASISQNAVNDVRILQQSGIIAGRQGNLFDPQGMAARAEVSAVLHRFLKLTIDPSTVQGWQKNDSGLWCYYQDGQKFIGWKEINGIRYYFQPDGTSL